MTRMRNIHLITLLAFAINGCSGGNSDGDAVNALNNTLEEQTEVMREQNAQQAAPITLSGIVSNLESDELINSGTITLKIGNTAREPVAIENGGFTITNVPAFSDYELWIEPANQELLARAFYGTTIQPVGTHAHQDLGTLEVSPAQTITFSVQNPIDESHINQLTFYADSSAGNNSRSNTRRHRSSYNATTNLYSITVPSELDIRVYADIDLNQNNIPDYLQYNIGEVRRLEFFSYSNRLAYINTLWLLPNQRDDANSLTFGITIVDEQLSPVPGLATLFQSDTLGDQPGVYDESTGQYVFQGQFTDRAFIIVPSFSVGNKYYQSTSVEISERNEADVLLEYNVNIYNSNNADAYYRIPAPTSAIDIVIHPTNFTPSSNISVVLKTIDGTLLSQSYNVFFSNSVSLLEDSVTLRKLDSVRIIRGNDSPTDNVDPGATTYETYNEDVNATTELSLNNTLLTATPDILLDENFSYQYIVNEVIDTAIDLPVSPSNATSNIFTAKSNGTFNIQDVTVDNFNYLTNRILINPTNTAGTPANPSTGSGWTRLIFPNSISNLENLTLTKILTTELGNTHSHSRTYRIVTNGNVQTSRVLHLDVARNENIIRTGNTFTRTERGANIKDGYTYAQEISQYMYDHHASQENSVTFLYEYETKDGVFEDGEITLHIQ